MDHPHFHPARGGGGLLESLHLAPRSPLAPTRSTIRSTLMDRATRALVPRSSCTSSDSNLCEKPATSGTTLPIVLAVVIPIVGAIIVLFFLHRRSVKKLRQEDLSDPHKSLDFGMGEGGKKGGKVPEMTITDAEKSLRSGRTVSLDLSTGSPYILPAGLHSSRESFHSMSRAMNDPHDPYRPVTMIRDDSNSARGYRNDGSSFRTGSSGNTDRMNGSLIRNASRMSQSQPLRSESLSPQDYRLPEIKFPEPVADRARSPSPLGKPAAETNAPAAKDGLAPGAVEANRDSYFDKNANALRKSNDYLGSIISGIDSAAAASDKTNSAPLQDLPAPPVIPSLPRIHSQTAVVQDAEDTKTTSFISTSSYGDGFKVTPPSPTHNTEIKAPVPTRTSIIVPALGPQEQAYRPGSLAVNDLGLDARRLSVSVRPLPLDDPSENPEERANRIRSFYKEYFDDSRPDPKGMSIYGDYFEDYTSEYLADGAVFDPASGQFVAAQPPAPFAAPVTRRAMTPPPRAPPRFRGAPPPGGRARAESGFSRASGPMPPRGMSSMSGRVPPAGPRRPIPPPAPLNTIPTPSKLNEDSAIFNAADFAPPLSYRDRQAGRRPDSPMGEQRPYSPSVRPHTPLVGAFDELAAMPSPHMLRNSGTFTALDFAPPPRLRDPSGGSDAGSIRSNRSGMSAVAMHSVRAGAYRVSRIPKELGGTKEDLLASLRPKMDLINKA